MKVQKKVSLGAYAKVGVDFKDGDVLVVLDAGQTTEGEFGTQHVFKIRLPNNEEKNLSFNQTSINHLIEIYGDETEKWAGLNVKVWAIKQNVAGKFRTVVYLTAPDQTLEGMGE